MSEGSSLAPTLIPLGEFMTPLQLTRESIYSVPQTAGCYLIYLEEQPFYAGMSACNIRSRLWAHATGRGSKRVRHMLACQRAMYFEYLEVFPWEDCPSQVVAGTEFVFMMLHSGGLLPGNMRADNFRHFGIERDPALLVMDYFEDVREVLLTARKDVFFVDPYLDAELVSRYMANINIGVSVRLLRSRGTAALVPPIDLAAMQVDHPIELRSTSSPLYGRFLFLDGVRGFRSAASFTVGGRTEPTQLTEITDEPRMQEHEAIWSAATTDHSQAQR
ncbi:hypothetical protein BURK2_01729 [Burkholderiales bacterium]|nr:hypothetical protein BURK2_01729 [Burkholderiales bacterium]